MKNLKIVILALLVMTFFVGCKGSDYKKAYEYMNSKNYEGAAMLFSDLGDYEDSHRKYLECKYLLAESKFSEGNIIDAETIYKEIEPYEDSLDRINECEYQKAEECFNLEDYESAKEIYKNIIDYKDAKEKIEVINREITHQKYGNIIEVLKQGEWFTNGGSDLLLNKIMFDDDNVIIEQISFDGNGRHVGDTSKKTYTIDDDNIYINTNSTTIEVSYKMIDNNILFNDGYFTKEQILEGIQGNWTLREKDVLGMYGEYNLVIDGNYLIHENACESLRAGYKSFYYGPYSGNFEIGDGNLVTDVWKADNYFYNIINGSATILYYDSVMSKGGGLKGENGYNF